MIYGPYKAKSVAGKPIINNLIIKDNFTIDNVAFNGNKFEMDGSFKGGETKVVADYYGTSIAIEEDFSDRMYETYPPLKGDLYITVRFKIDDYTVQTKDVPVEMTLDEIEKKLGHKVLLTSKSHNKDERAK